MNYYAEALDICSSDRDDWKQIVVEIAKKHPKLVVEIGRKGFWQGECREMYAGGDKIGAIKLCRSMTGMTLKEAKEAVESLT